MVRMGWHLSLTKPGLRRSKLEAKFFGTRICLAIGATFLLGFVAFEDYANHGRLPLLGLIVVALLRALLARRRVDSWLASGLVIACITSMVFLAELSGKSLVPVLIIASAALAAVLVALTFAETAVFEDLAPGLTQTPISIDLRSLMRVGARLAPMALALAVVLPEVSHLAAQWFPQFEAPLAGGGGMSRTTSSGRTRTGLTPDLEPGAVSALTPDTTPILALNYASPEPFAPASSAHTDLGDEAIYLRSFTLSDGYGLSWRMAPEDVIGGSLQTAQHSPFPGAAEQVARAVMLRRNETFVFYHYGTRVRASNNLRLLPDGGALIAARPGLFWGQQPIWYDIEKTTNAPRNPGPSEDPRPPDVLANGQHLGPASSAAAQKLLHRLTGLSPAAGAEHLGQLLSQLRQLFSQGGFSYTLQPGAIDTADPVSALEIFLETKRHGFCEHYAAATASLLRTAGIRTRIVSGLMRSKPQRGATVVFTRADAHAWVEYYHPTSRQWVAIDPTAWVTPLTSLPVHESRSTGSLHLLDTLGESFETGILHVGMSIRETFEQWQNSDPLHDRTSLLDLALHPLSLKLACIALFFAVLALLRWAFKQRVRARHGSRRHGLLPSKLPSYGLFKCFFPHFFKTKQNACQDDVLDSYERDSLIDEVTQTLARATGQNRHPHESLREFLLRLVRQGYIAQAATEEFLGLSESILYARLDTLPEAQLPRRRGRRFWRKKVKHLLLAQKI